MQLSPTDQLAIQELYHWYAWALDTGDLDGYIATFTEDGEFVGFMEGGSPHAKGHDALRALAEAFNADPAKKGYHWYTGIIIEAAEYGASGKCYFMHVLARDDGIGELRHALHYDDEIVKQNGKWLFRRRSTHAL